MPMHWRRFIDVLSFLIGLTLTLCLRFGLDWGWLGAIAIGVVVFVALPFVLSRLVAIFIIRRMERGRRRMSQP